MELTKLQRKPSVYFPTEIENTHYVGPLYGLYIEDTNIFNVVSLGENANYPMLKAIGTVEEHRPESLSEGQLTGFYEDGKVIFLTSDGKECKKEPYSLKMDLFSRNVGILESDVMLKTGAVLVGCGSVGSLVALELAKAGVGRFLLIDNDILGYHNLCRHQCGLLDVGRYKTEAVRDRILQINPSAKVVVQNCIIQEVPLKVFDDFCDTDTIVIGGADNRQGDLYANQIAKEVGMPLMSIGCWERAFAGEIFY